MSRIILDMSGGNTCRNDKKIAETMIRQIAEVDTGEHELVLKWQLFKKAEPNIPLSHDIFKYAYDLADHLGYKTTSSIFDLESLYFLMKFDVPFVKIANQYRLYSLIDEMIVDIPVYVSVPSNTMVLNKQNYIVYLACVSQYPASTQDYELFFPAKALGTAVSDHTVGWDLYNKYKPAIIEKHFVHERNKDNPDAGLFAVTQKELAAIL